MGKIVSVNISAKKHVAKKPVDKAEVVAGKGLEGDSHAGSGSRQVSLLMMETVEKQRELLAKRIESGEAKPKKGKTLELVPGIYAENLTTSGLDLSGVKPGDELRVGQHIKLRITQIGKECHTNCAVYHMVGDCAMPREGIFCEVVEGGTVRPEDKIEFC